MSVDKLEAFVWKFGNGCANAHIDEFGNVVIDKWFRQTPTPTAQDIEAAIAEYAVKKPILMEISRLENTMSLRRVREAVRGPGGKAWLDNLDDQIAALRAQLTP